MMVYLNNILVSIWRKRIHFVTFLVSVFVLFASLLSAPSTSAATGLFRSLNWQARLLTSGGVNVADATYAVKFSIYDASTGGNRLWTAAGTTSSPSTVNVTVDDGLMTVLLGDSSSQNAFDFNWNQDSLYLGVTIGADSEMSPRKRLSSVPSAFVAETLQGNYASSSVTSTGGNLMNLRQTSTDAASASRTALLIETLGTSNVNDWLLRASNANQEVFSILRNGDTTTTGSFVTQGNIKLGDATTDLLTVTARFGSDLIPSTDLTYSIGSSSLKWLNLWAGSATFTRLDATTVSTTNFLATNATSSWIGATTVSTTNLYINGTQVTGSGSQTLQQVTNQGASTTNQVYLFGGATVSNLTVTSSASLQGTTFTVATGTSATMTQLYVASALTFQSASGQSLLVAGKNVCLSDGTNCSSSGGSADTNWTFASTTGALRPTTTTADIIFGSTATSSAVGGASAYFDMSDSSNGTSSFYFGYATNANVYIGTTTYGGGLGSSYFLDGNDALVQGKLGSIEGLFSATGVTIGTSTTVLADGALYKSNGGDFTFNLNNPGSNWRFRTTSTMDLLTVASSGFIGIRTSNPQAELDVRGDIRNIIVDSSGFTSVTSHVVGTSAGSGPSDLAIDGNYLYMSNGFDSSIFDVSDPATPRKLYSLNQGTAMDAVAFSGAQVMFSGRSVSAQSAILDVANHTSPRSVGTFSAGDHPSDIAAQGSLVYTVSSSTSAFTTWRLQSDAGPLVLSTLTTGFSGPVAVAVQGAFAYIADQSAVNGFRVVNITNPNAPVAFGSVAVGTNPSAVAVQGRNAYVTNLGSSSVSIIDISNPATPTVSSTVSVGVNPRAIVVQGRYAFVANRGSDTISVIDVASSTAPSVVATISVPGGPNALAISGRNLYVGTATTDRLIVIRLPGTETSALSAHSAELGNLSVLGNASIFSQLQVHGGISVGYGGIFSGGAFSVMSTNTTSTFAYAVSSTAGEFQRLTVGGISVCLANGTNCTASTVPNGAYIWTDNSASNTVRLTTTTRDLFMGGSTTDTAGFVFDSGAGTSTIFIGMSTNTNVLIGTSSYSGGLGLGFGLSGNDLLSQGSIGSIEGLFSATGVTVGAATDSYTVYGENSLRHAGVNDFVFNLNTATTSWRFRTTSTQDYLVVASSGNVGIRKSTPTEALDVQGRIRNIISANQSISATASTTLGTVAADIVVTGGYAVIADREGGALRMVDISDPSALASNLGSVSIAGISAVAVAWPYAYAVSTSTNNLTIVDLTRAKIPTILSTLDLGSTSTGVTVQGSYVFAVLSGLNKLGIASVTNPSSPQLLNSVVVGSDPRDVVVSNRFAYVTNFLSNNVSIVDLEVISSPVVVGTSTVGTSPLGIALQGRYAYVANSQGSSISIIDIVSSTNPVIASTVTGLASNPVDVTVSGRYLASAHAESGVVTVVDVASSTSPQALTTIISIGANPSAITVQGNHWFVASLGSGSGQVNSIRIPGVETASLQAHVAEIGSLSISDRLSISGPLSVGGGMNVGWGGLYSVGAFNVASTNTTSTFAYAVSSTSADFSSRLTVGGVSVCLSTGSNCPNGASIWSQSSTSNTVYLTTSTRDVLLGGSTTDTAGFIYDYNTGTSTIFIGMSTNTNVLIGTTTYSGGLGFGFGLSGNDLLAQGSIGSIEGLFSATGVTVGTSTASYAVYGLNSFYRNAVGDYSFLQQVASSSWRFFTSSTERLTVASTGFIGINNATPTEMLDVIGNIKNLVATNQTLTAVTSTFFGIGSRPQDLVMMGRTAFVIMRDHQALNIIDYTDAANPTVLSTTTLTTTDIRAITGQGQYIYIASANDFIGIYDISNLGSPVLMSSITSGSLVSTGGLQIYGKYLYALDSSGNRMRIFDVSNPNSPTLVGMVNFNSGSLPAGLAIQGRYAYVANSGNATMNVVDIMDPSAPVTMATTTFTENKDRIDVQGSFAYVVGNQVLNIVNISIATSSQTMATTSLAVTASQGSVDVQGRYAYVASGPNLFTIDVSSSSRPIVMSTTTRIGNTGGNGNVRVAGGYVFHAEGNSSNDRLSVYAIPMVETPALIAHSAEVGSLQVRTDASVYGQFSVFGGANIGTGGIYSQGAVGIFASSTIATTTSIVNTASATVAVLSVKAGCQNSTTTIMQVGNRSDDLKFRILCNGNVQADGAFMSPAADFAEYFPSTNTIAVGTVVALQDDGAGSPLVTPASPLLRAQTLGVVSQNPSFVGGVDELVLEGSASRTAVALLGRIAVSAQGPISSGDILMAGIDGKAVRASGTGMILGTSVSSVNTGVDATIPIFLNPQWWAGDLFGTSSTTPYSNLLLSNLYIPSNVANASTNYFSSSELSFATSKWNGAAAQNYRFNLLASSNASSSFLEVKGILPDNSSSTLFSINASGTVQASQDLRAGRNLVINTSSTRPVSIGVQTGSSTYVVTDADGWSTSGTFDYAEQFPATEKLEAGDLVMVDPQGEERVQKTQGVSSIPIGIVSTKPAFIAGRNTPGTYPIALAGRVPLKINQEGGSIAPGDPLSASSMPGVAKKAQSGDYIVGYALEPATSGSATVSTFVAPHRGGGALAMAQPSVTSAPTTILRQSGLARISAGQKEVLITFPSIQAYPLIQATPYGPVEGTYWFSGITDGSFTIVLSDAQASDLTFAWSVEATQAGDRLISSDRSSALIDPLTGITILDSAVVEPDSVSTPESTIAPTSTPEIVEEDVVIDPILDPAPEPDSAPAAESEIPAEESAP